MKKLAYVLMSVSAALLFFVFSVGPARIAAAAVNMSTVAASGNYVGSVSGVTGTPGFISATNGVKLEFLGPGLVNVDTMTAAALPAYTTSGGPGAGFTLTFAASPASIDGVAQATGMTFLLHHGAARTDNGVYRWITYASGGAGTATRVPGFDTASTIPGSKVAVRQGTIERGQTLTYRNVGAITMGTTGIFYHFDQPTPRHGRRARYDFTQAPSVGANAALYFGEDGSMAAVGTGTAFALGPTGAAPLSLAPANTATIQGIIIGSTGSTATGYYTIQNGWPAVSTQPDGGGAILVSQDMGFEYEARWATTTLSTAAQEYCNLFGLSKQRAAGQRVPADFVGIAYDRLGTAATDYAAIASVGGVTTGTFTDTNLAIVANTFDIVGLRKDIGSNSIELLVNRAVVATYSSNIPNEILGVLVGTFKNTGATAVASLMVDWYSLDVQWPQGRA